MHASGAWESGEWTSHSSLLAGAPRHLRAGGPAGAAIPLRQALRTGCLAPQPAPGAWQPGTARPLTPAPSVCPACRLSLAVGAAVAAASTPHNAAVCAVVVEHPGAAAATQRLYTLAGALACRVPLPVSLGAASDAAGQCRMLFAFSQLGLGLLAPLLADCLAAARRFAVHQAQQRVVVLPEERGALVWALDTAWQLLLEGYWMAILLVSWILLSTLWAWTAPFFSGIPFNCACPFRRRHVESECV